MQPGSMPKAARENHSFDSLLKTLNATIKTLDSSNCANYINKHNGDSSRKEEVGWAKQLADAIMELQKVAPLELG